MPKNKKYFNWLRKKQQKQGNGRPYTSMRKESTVSYLHQQQQDSPSSNTLHRSIQTLPYHNFILILTGGDLSPLIVSGQPPIDELVTAWETICEEYSSAIKNHKSKSVFECYRKIVTLQSQIQVIDSGLWFLTQQYDADIALLIHEMGYTLITECDNQEEYLQMIKRVQTEAKTLVVILNQYANEYKMLNPDGIALVQRDYQSYIDELAVLSKFQGYRLQAKEISTEEYCSIVNSCIAYSESLKEK